MQLQGKDPNKHYVFVDPNLKDWYAHYVGMGYTPERKSEGGPDLVAGSTSKEGDIFESHGCVLMSIDKSIKDQMDEDGREYARGRMEEVRRARQGQAIRKEYVGSFPDANIEFDVDIPSREREL